MTKSSRLVLDKFRQHSFAKQWVRGIGVLALMAIISGVALVFAWKSYQPRAESALFLKQSNDFALNVEQINTQTANLLYSQLRMIEDYRLNGVSALTVNGFSMMQLQGTINGLIKEVDGIKGLLASEFWTFDLNKSQQVHNKTLLKNAIEEVSQCLESFNQLNASFIKQLREKTLTSHIQQVELEVQLHRKGQQLTQAVTKLAVLANQQAKKVLLQADEDERWLLKGVIACSALAFLWNGGLFYFLGKSLKSNSALVKEVSEMASRDSLTGLLNRRGLEQQIMQIEIAALQNSGVSLSGQTCLMLIDLDFFKKYNDKYGHVRGDAHLKACAAAWRNGIRGRDVLARMGGEEFAVIMPNCTEEQAYATAQRLQAAMPQNTSFSAGISLCLPNEIFDVWYERADQALYKAKASGRARIELAGIKVAVN